MIKLIQQGDVMSKILIIRLTSLGDVIFTIPLACALKNSHEKHEIGWLVAEKGLEIVKNNPCVDKHHFVPLNEWKKRPFSLKTFKELSVLIKELRAEKYDIAFDCQQMFKNLFLFWFCGAKRRITFKDAREFSILGGNEFIEPKANFRDFNYHIVERNLDFARYIGIEPKSIDFTLPETYQLSKDKINDLLMFADKDKPIAVISPATTWSNKHWHERNWAKVIDGISSKCNIVFTGTSADEQLIERVLDKTKGNLNYINLAGKTNLDELRELFTRAKVILSPDSGSAHLAWASTKPAVVTIFTATPVNRFGPYGDDKKYISIGADLPCQPCFKKKCKQKYTVNDCCYLPDPDEIINIVNELL